MPTKPPEEGIERLGIVGYTTYQLVSRISEPSTVSVGNPSAGEFLQVFTSGKRNNFVGLTPPKLT